jgi:enolase
MSTKIKRVLAREILDSRGNPTVEVDVEAGTFLGRACVPSGASTGTHEALELRDGEKRFGGKGVQKAVGNVNKIIAPKIIGKDISKQREIDELMIELDGTENKSKLGANAILGVSMAVARCAAECENVPLYRYLGGPKVCILPMPLMNVINGGAHAGNELAVQEFMIIPACKDFRESLRAGVEVYQALKGIIKEKYGRTAINVGDEGGYAPPMKRAEEALDVISEAIKKSAHDGEVMIGLDCAATNFHSDGKYSIDGKIFGTDELIDFYETLVSSYPIVSIEDPLQEEDFDGMAKMLRLGIQTVGDDIFVTNPERLAVGIKKKSANALLLKLNQIGSVTEALDVGKTAMKNGWAVVVSHRSGETGDTFISDLAVALGCGQIKSGAPCRSERTAKYNRLLRIEEELKTPKFPGFRAMAHGI